MEVLFKGMLPTEAPMVQGVKEYNSNVYWGKQMTKILEENHLLSKIRLIRLIRLIKLIILIDHPTPISHHLTPFQPLGGFPYGQTLSREVRSRRTTLLVLHHPNR